MAYKDLRLIKCVSFEKDEKHWGMCDEWVSKYRKEATGLHTFAYGENEAYAVTTAYSAHGENDGADSEHYDSLSVYLYPIPLEDAQDEEKVRALVNDTECCYSGSFDATQIKIYDQGYYTDSIMFPVFYAIDAYKSSLRKKQIREQMEKGEISVGLNAVKVYKGGEARALTILDFESQTALAEVWGFEKCNSVGVEPLPEGSAKAFGIDRPLCWFYPVAGSFGRPRVSAYIDENGKHHLSVYFSNYWDTGSSAVICAYAHGKPAPLTEEEAEKITAFASANGEKG